MKHMKNRNVLITGGSEGIGYELAKCFAKDGYALTLCARREEKLEWAKQELEKAYGISVRTIALDLSCEGSGEALFQAVHDTSYDVVVNNAGIGSLGKVIDTNLEQEKNLVRINVENVLVLSKLFAEKFAKERHGELINIASTGAFQPGPYIASYYASKAFVLSYSEALAMEMKEYGVRVYCYCPGPVKTAFYEKYGGKPVGKALTSQQAAVYLYTHRKDRCVIIPGIANRLGRLFPRNLKAKIVMRIKKRMLEREK